MEEIWRPVQGFEGHYSVSNNARVRSEDRKVVRKDSNLSFLKGKVLAQTPNVVSGHLYVSFTKAGKRDTFLVHRLVAEAFIPNPENLPLVRHLNDVPGDNRLENLAWGTKRDNSYDAVRNGLHRNGNMVKTHCKNGHEFTEENSYVRKTVSGGYGRTCKKCKSEYARQVREKMSGLPDDDPRHGTTRAYNYYKCWCAECTKANRDYERNRLAKKREIS